VDRLFSVSLDPWYRAYRSDIGKPAKPASLLEYYLGPDGYFGKVPFSDHPLPTELPSPVLLDGEHWDFGPFGKIANPTHWLINGTGSKVRLTRYCPCHGDLHVKNIFVLPDNSPRLIDFGDTALGHVFRDFAALETSIRLTCCNTTDLGALQEAADSLATVDSLGDHIDYRTIAENQEYDDLRESLKIVMQIRRSALDAVGDHFTTVNMKEYLIAVTLRMLRYADGVADEVSSKESPEEKVIRRWHALYVAAKSAEQAERLK
jgi:hypothetical protein